MRGGGRPISEGAPRELNCKIVRKGVERSLKKMRKERSMGLKRDDKGGTEARKADRSSRSKENP